MSNQASSNHFRISRKKFLLSTAKVTGTLLLSPIFKQAAAFSMTPQAITVGEIMDLFIKAVPGGALPKTVDTLKAGSRDMKVTGIVTSMFATVEVIRQTIASGANFIISHEPTFYNHNDDTDWLQQDHVYRYKADLLKQNNIAVWRNHDYIHSLIPDGVTQGMLARLQWQKYSDKKFPELVTLPATTLKELITYLKNTLNISKVRYIGNESEQCSRILYFPGAAGGKAQIQGIGEFKPDVFICGELQEWETAEYIRDARATGANISLIVLGHIASEDEGSEYMLAWLQKNVPQVKSVRIKAQGSLSFL